MILKKILLLTLILGTTLSLSAQTEQLQEGNFVIDVNTAFGSFGGIVNNGTGFRLTTSDDFTIWNIGGEAGYFVDENLAIKLGAGFGEFDNSGIFSYKIGAKYYVAEKIPLQLDFSGELSDEVYGNENPFYIGLQGGLALFLGDMVSVEPTLRYGFATNESFENVFQLLIGFSIFL